MKKQFLVAGAAVIFGFAACNDSANDANVNKDSTTTTTTQTNMERKGTEIANFASRTFMDLKTNKPIKLHWDTVHYYYVDESGNTPYYYYDPATSDTFDYWGRRLNSYLNNVNGDYTIDEERLNSSVSTTTTDTGTSSTGNMKVKSTDDKYKEKTDTSKLKVTDDKMKAKKK